MPKYLCIAVLTLCFACPSLAQDTSAPTGPTQAKPAKKEPTKKQRSFDKKPPKAAKHKGDADDNTPGPLAGQTRRIKQALQLTDEQSAKFDQILAKARDDHKKQQATVGKVLAEVRAARAQNKSEQFAKAVERLRAIASSGGLAVLNELESILTDEQKPKLERIRQRFEDRPKLTAQVIMEAMVRLRGDTHITKDQAPEFDRIVVNLCDSLDPSPRTRDVSPDEISDILAQLQEAVAAGDEDKIRAVRSRLVRERTEPFDALIAAVLDVDAVLNAPQRKTLEDFIVAVPALPKSSNQPRDARGLVRLAKSCKPTAEQLDQLKPVEGWPVDRANAATTSRDLYKIYARIIDVLNDQQWEHFKTALKTDGHRGRKKSGG